MQCLKKQKGKREGEGEKKRGKRAREKGRKEEIL